MTHRYWERERMLSVNLILLLAAFVCFLLAAFGVSSRINLIAVGLALWILSLIIGR